LINDVRAIELETYTKY